MKNLLTLLSLVIILNINITYSQENIDSDTSSTKLENYIFDYAISNFNDFRAVLYLYRTELKKEPENLKDIKNFVSQYNLSYKENLTDTIKFISNKDGSSIIEFTLVSNENIEHKLLDTILIKNAKGVMNLGTPMSKGSSISSIYGEIKSGEVQIDSGDIIVLRPYKSTVYFTRTDIETIKRIANME